MKAGKWHHVVGTYNPGTAQSIYIDGVLIETGGATNNIASTGSDILIGATLSNAPTNFFNGKIDDARIYNRALSDAEVKNLYLATKGNPNLGAVCADGSLHGVSDLAGHWPLDETSGTVANDVLGINNGSMQGGLSGADTISGKHGTALDFDGSNDYIAISDSAVFDITGELTLSAWVNASTLIDTTSPPDHEGIIAKYLGSGNQRSFQIFIDNDNADKGKVGFVISSDGTSATTKNIASSSAIAINNWYHIAATFEPNNSMKIYIDGKLNVNETVSIPSNIYSGSADVWIGTQFDTSFSLNYFDGAIDDPRIYSRALSADEIRALYLGTGGS